jgi:hypothetical protein
MDFMEDMSDTSPMYEDVLAERRQEALSENPMRAP